MTDFFSVVIAGSRGLQVQVARIRREVDTLMSGCGVCAPTPLQIVSGGEKTGADRCGEVFAALYKHPVRLFPADWNTYGKGAGVMRNEQMARYADAALVFVKAEPTPGSSNMATWMLLLNKPVKVLGV